MYIHELIEWPNFSWDSAKLTELLAEVRYLQGHLLGQMNTLGFQLRTEATLQVLTQDVVKTSEIEGERLNTAQVRSSIARRLGLDIGALTQIDRHVEGIVDIMLDATQNYEKSLTEDRLFDWHAALFPMGRSSIYKITVGGWRTKESGPMQVISGPHGREKIHFEAPTYDRLKKEMARFLKWFNAETDTDLVIKSSLAHLWFVTIHPFDDGNGRIAIALADMLLARSEKSKQRFYSMSAQIRRVRNEYYDILEKTQKGNIDITSWINWYLSCLKNAIISSEEILKAVLTKARFWENHKSTTFNDRQRLILNRLLDGFEGKLTTSKWANIAKCSHDTALRDINDLVDRKILIKEAAGGRSTHYQISM
jgi:Fic family protein